MLFFRVGKSAHGKRATMQVMLSSSTVSIGYTYDTCFYTVSFPLYKSFCTCCMTNSCLDGALEHAFFLIIYGFFSSFPKKQQSSHRMFMSKSIECKKNRWPNLCISNPYISGGFDAISTL